MSKKTAKRAKKAVKAVKKRASLAKPTAKALQAPIATKQTAAATIFVYDVDGECRIRTSPQLLSANPGYVEWTVVNLTPRPMPEIEITWQKDSPWGGAPIPIRDGNARLALPMTAKQGRFKYNVSCDGHVEDPEIEYPPN